MKQGILGVHPDLAGRLAQHGGLTDESLREQRSAGLMADSGGEKKQEICELNDKYDHAGILVYLLTLAPTSVEFDY